MGSNLKSVSDLKPLETYELVMQEQLKELNSFGLVYKHKKSGARVVVISNDDENKVFSVGFRTPPKDSTGVAHIIEHTVLCGSREFPAKDPFVELVKGSLNTFLNAMTYSDKTVYPVASLNEKDFQNLMHVYLDAVFYPNIYQREEIFKQEGWHYELEDKDSELTYNGVVYNEMKGVFSSPEQILYRTIQTSLFPDTTYGTESGGDPEFIPDLTNEDFLDFHKKYYHPSNSYIYLYGDMDVEEKLNWMDEQYLSHFTEIKVDSEIIMQPSFTEMHVVHGEYSLAENESTVDKTYLAYNAVIDTSLNKEYYLAFNIIQYVLLSAPGAPLKQALLDRGIGKDILGSYDNGILQPYFSVVAKNVNANKIDDFISVIKDTLTKLCAEGLSERALKAAINYYEFKYREADFGSFPKGLMYGLQIMDSWLYDDSAPFMHIQAEETFDLMKEKIGTGYYEELIIKYLVKNSHSSLVVVEPKVGLTKKMEEETKCKLANYKATLSDNEIERIIRQTKELKVYQDTPSTEEELEKIPLLSTTDIHPKSQALFNEVKEVSDITVLHHNYFTNDIAYLTFLFDANAISEEEIPYLSLLSSVLGFVDTAKHSFMEFSNEVHINTGGMYADVSMYSKAGVPNKYTAKFEIRTKVLYEQIEKAFELLQEMLFESRIEDDKRLKEIIQELVSRMSAKLSSSGHMFAVSRATSYFSANGYFNDMVGGVSYYYFLKDLDSQFEEKKASIKEMLRLVLIKLLKKDNFMISIAANETGYRLMEKPLNELISLLPLTEETKEITVLHPTKKNEGIKTSSKVQYVARAGNFIEAGFVYTGVLKILKVILSYDYLWLNVRVKGGAYGCMSGFGLDGNGYFASYRDPNLKETNNIYNGTVSYLEQFNASERDMTKYIIGTISGMDTPMTASTRGRRSLSAYLSGVSDLDLQKEREQVLSAQVDDIRALAKIVKAVLDQNNLCVVGNEDRIVAAGDMFDNIITL